MLTSISAMRKIELMEPARADSPVAKFLERNPQAGFIILSQRRRCRSDSRRRARQRRARARLSTLQFERASAEPPFAFCMHPKDFLGALVELEERGTQTRAV